MLICQLTDLHVRPLGKASNRVSETNMLTERAFASVAAFTPRPDVVVLSGDLTECGLAEEYTNLSRLIERHLSMPVFVIPGNHDRRDTLRSALAHLPGVTVDPTYVQYAVDDYPVRLVMLDTLVPGSGYGELRPEQLAWLDRTLAAAPDKPTLVAMHHPPFQCGIAHMDRISLRNAADFAGVIARHKQVERIVCGHHHRPITARVAHAIASICPRPRIRWRWRCTRRHRRASCSNRRPSSCTGGPRRTGSCRTRFMSSGSPGRFRSFRIRTTPGRAEVRRERTRLTRGAWRADLHGAGLAERHANVMVGGGRPSR